MLEVGTDVGGYIVDGELGRGGMGVVYAATHPVIGKRVAIKVLRAELAEASNANALERFTQEARAVNQIGHPHIVNIFGFGQTPDGDAYLMMDLLAGESLRTRVKRGPLHASEAASIVDETASALLAVHDKGFIHRDLKPDNVFLVPREGDWPEARLLDFGLAKLLPQGGEKLSAFRTKTGVVLGTPDYMAPELVRQRGPIDHRVDVYALGVLAFEMLTGRRPFLGTDGSLEKLQRICDESAPPVQSFAPHVPAELAEVIDALLAKDRELRPSLGEVRMVVKRLRGGPELPSQSVVSMEAASATVSDLPAAALAPTPPPPPLPADDDAAPTPPLVPLPADDDAAPTPPTALLRATGLAPVPPVGARNAELRTEPLLLGLSAAASHGGTVLGVAPAPMRVSSPAISAAQPAVSAAQLPAPPAPRRRPGVAILVAIALALVALAIAIALAR